MLLTSLSMDPLDFTARTGWTAKPQGLCQGDVCVPAPGSMRADGTLDATVISERLRMPLVHDEAHGLWALGPSSGGKALTTAVAPDPVLKDRNGDSFSLSSLRGRRVIMVAWASW
jgi:hypothetical protein